MTLPQPTEATDETPPSALLFDDVEPQDADLDDPCIAEAAARG